MRPYPTTQPAQPARHRPPVKSGDRVWRGTLAILESLSGWFETFGPQPMDTSAAPAVEGRKRIRGIRARPGACDATTFTDIERLSPNVVSISWRDATRGCYAEQQWRRRVSRIRGTCVLSGGRIARGSIVYVPAFNASHMPCNAGAMILESALAEAGYAPGDSLCQSTG